MFAAFVVRQCAKRGASYETSRWLVIDDKFPIMRIDP